MQTITVNTGRPYQVYIGTKLLEASGSMIKAACGGERAVIVTDSNVGPLYAQIVEQSLAQEGYIVTVCAFSAGEEHKRAQTYVGILEFMARSELTRQDIVVALGGGVVGDLAGFAAATYMRGISYVQMPTSLLAMVDSSVGGKTAIDLEGGKNLAGSFWQPRIVIADVGCLGTLDPEQFADGCGEIIKHAAIADADLFKMLEEQPLTYETLLANLPYATHIIARNIEIKRDVVSADEQEQNMRKLLNFGHSIGHAVEACLNYQAGHGTCVAIGMVALMQSAVQRGICPAEVPHRIEALCQRHGLATRCRLNPEAVFEAALHDKKRRGETIDLVYVSKIGKAYIETTDLSDFRAIIAEGLSLDGLSLEDYEPLQPASSQLKSALEGNAE